MLRWLIINGAIAWLQKCKKGVQIMNFMVDKLSELLRKGVKIKSQFYSDNLVFNSEYSSQLLIEQMRKLLSQSNEFENKHQINDQCSEYGNQENELEQELTKEKEKIDNFEKSGCIEYRKDNNETLFSNNDEDFKTGHIESELTNLQSRVNFLQSKLLQISKKRLQAQLVTTLETPQERTAARAQGRRRIFFGRALGIWGGYDVPIPKSESAFPVKS
ncbi:MAG: hypothetical protein EZS28_001580 [Streblomastix strix]|uniref:Uncharacterized protein n=1 Tax=Streblomastix strix TaxID=222440 RepID=A0A5J4X6U2_9EUKA|nr:MAG: hypothetical protein EZS28_001580 [Streblomastix strix]